MVESWLVVGCTILWTYLIAKLAAPPGPSFTAVWLFIGFQGYILKSESVLTCFYMGGAGLILGWYGAQIVDGSVWPRIMNIWIPRFPWAHRGVLTIAVRIADLYLHALPFFVSQWTASFEAWLQILIVERAYFLIIDGCVLGDGSGVNQVYQIQPRASPRFFWTLQGLSILGQAIAVFNHYVLPELIEDNSSKLAVCANLEACQHITIRQLCQNPLICRIFGAVIVACLMKTHCIEIWPQVKLAGAAKIKSVSNLLATAGREGTSNLLYALKQSFIR